MPELLNVYREGCLSNYKYKHAKSDNKQKQIKALYDRETQAIEVNMREIKSSIS